jgi:hypothetical protein
VAALGLAAAFALLAGCGGGGDSTSSNSSSGASTSAGSSSASFVADADSICKDVNDQIAKIPRPKTKSDVSPFLDKFAPVAFEGISRLTDLTPPDGQQAVFDAWVATLKKEQTQIEAAQKAAKTNPSKAIQISTAEATLNDKGKKQAQALGLKECGKGSS